MMNVTTDNGDQTVSYHKPAVTHADEWAVVLEAREFAGNGLITISFARAELGEVIADLQERAGMKLAYGNNRG